MKSLHRQLLAVVALAAITTIMGNVWLSRNAGAPVTNQTKEQTPSVTVTPKVITITLPGANPITTIKENYDSDDSLWHVTSKKFPLGDQHFEPNDLATISGQRLRAGAVTAAITMFAAAKSAGYSLTVGSGYRSYATQTTLFNNYAAQYGEAQANTFSARPGQSEHQTGLAMDVATTDRKCYLDACFADTPAGQWLAAHAHEYGFILRYPKDKTDITQYIFEPWHFRYVGVDLATAIYRSGLTLDEAKPYLDTALAELKKSGEVK